jgi:hypothetical protein
MSAEQENTSWFNKGYGGVKGEEQAIATKYGPQHFWMPADEAKTVVFLDNEPACIHEHNPKMNGSWKNWITCIRDVYPDEPACCETLAGDYQRYYVGYFTVIDCTAWTDKKGNKYQFELKLYGAKLKTLKLLQTKTNEDWGGGLANKVIKVRRTSAKDASVGNDFTMDREADMEKLWSLVTYKGKKLSEQFGKALEDEEERTNLLRNFAFEKGEGGVLVPKIPTFNYWEILKPKAPQEMRTFLKSGKVEDPDADSNAATGGAATATGGDGGADESIPF